MGTSLIRKCPPPRILPFDYAQDLLQGKGMLSRMIVAFEHHVSHRVAHSGCTGVPLSAHTRQSRPHSGLSFQLKVLKAFERVPSSLGSGSPVGPAGPYMRAHTFITVFYRYAFTAWVTGYTRMCAAHSRFYRLIERATLTRTS